MLGKDFYKIEVNAELSNERLKSLVLFYGPMIGHDALVLYQNLVLKGSTYSFNELNSLLTSLNISVDTFELHCGKLNEYRLLRTLKQDNKYIFVFNSPLTIKEFANDGILIREFIKRTSGQHYQELLSDLYVADRHDGFSDVSQSLSLELINSWNDDDETYLKKVDNSDKYNFNTLFDVNIFLRDISTNLLPMRFRTVENLKEIANLGDLYNVSYDKMRTFIPKVCTMDSNIFDLNQLKYLCINAKNDYIRVEQGNYNVPCTTFLMSLQDGKQVTEYDKKIMHNLSDKYHLNTSVINVLLEHGLKNCDNRLIENYLYPIASDLHRNNIQDAKSALNRLSKPYNKGGSSSLDMPTYAANTNSYVSNEDAEELLKSMGKK